MSCSCDEFTRSRPAPRARAGEGLPQIEVGAPAPAGTGLSRRNFLLRSAGLALSVYGASRLAPEALEAGVAEAASAPSAPVLVSVFLPGGVDSLSVLAPVGDPAYPTLRPTLALPQGSGTPFSEDSRLEWAAPAKSLATLHGEGKVSVLPAVGYDHPNQSHFTSRHFWEVGELDPNNRVGWLGRLLDRTGATTNPLQGLSLDGALSPSLASLRVPVAAVESPSSYTFDGRNVTQLAPALLAGHATTAALGTADPILAQARTNQVAAATLRAQLAPFSTYSSPVSYPAGSAFGAKLAGLGALLGAGLPLRCVTIDAPGAFDTHARQAGSLPRDLAETVDGVLAFQRDIEARGLADRVLVLLWSEFGRRGKENGSGGTDHGAGGAAFLVGTRAKGTMIGEFPGLAKLDSRGNLINTSDFRGLYCSLLEQWFATDAAALIPGASGFGRPALLK